MKLLGINMIKKMGLLVWVISFCLLNYATGSYAMQKRGKKEFHDSYWRYVTQIVSQQLSTQCSGLAPTQSKVVFWS